MSLAKALIDYMNRCNDLRITEKVLFMNNKAKTIFACMLLTAEDGLTTISYSNLISITGYSKTTVAILIKDLVKMGLINKTGTMGVCLEYTINYTIKETSEGEEPIQVQS